MTPARELFRDQETACWGLDEAISGLRFVEASEALKARGIHGWVYGTHAGLLLDGLRVSRTIDGRYVAEFPSLGVECTGPGGVEVDRSDHDLIENQVLDELRARGVLS